MAKEFSKKFYESKNWQDCRNSYASSKNYLCEKCGSPGEIVHHKIFITAMNVNNPNITLNYDNLQLLCRECHHRIHQGINATEEDIRFDEEGNIYQI